MFARVAVLLLCVAMAANACSSMMQGGGGCGGGGGCRHKARGVLQLEGDQAIEADFGEIYGLRLWEAVKPPANVSISQIQDPNFHFNSCCAERRLPAACQSNCNFATYTTELGVADTTAGDKCLVFCDQIPDKFTPIDYTYAACFGKFDQMKKCFYDNVATKAKTYLKEF